MILNSLSLTAYVVVQRAINQVLGADFLCVVKRNSTSLVGGVLVVETHDVLTARAQVFLFVGVGSLNRTLNLCLAHKTVILLIFAHFAISLPLVTI
jgi:hypothetical protein